MASEQFKVGQDRPRQSSVVTIFAIWNTMMGTSMLAMAYGLNQAGFTLGLLLILTIGNLFIFVTITYGVLPNFSHAFEIVFRGNILLRT